MAEKPGWISDQTVTVEIDGLHSFSRYLQQELDLNVRPNAEKVRAKLGEPVRDSEQLSFGTSAEYAQGRAIGNYHATAVTSANQLLNDLQLGLQAIASAARNIADDFRSADDLNHMDLSRVDAYFAPMNNSRPLEEHGGSGTSSYAV
jgi:hypothetical protein